MKVRDNIRDSEESKNSGADLKGAEILFEDKHILVCYKPAGIATQSRQIGTPDMVSILKNHLAAQARNAQAASASSASKTSSPSKTLSPSKTSSSPKNPSPSKTSSPSEPYLGVIHRLDQPVEGVLVFAKTPFAARELTRELTSHGFGKYYRALVSHAPEKPEACLENYLVKDARTNTSRICAKGTQGAKFARLYYKTVPEGQRYFTNPVSSGAVSAPGTDTCVEIGAGADTCAGIGAGTDHQRASDANFPAPCELDIHLDTGRHHQIRVQLAGIGCPIVGDAKYHSEPQSKRKKKHSRLMLCSYRLTFTHPKTRKQMVFSLL